jgi:hypothetical protein
MLLILVGWHHPPRSFENTIITGFEGKKSVIEKSCIEQGFLKKFMTCIKGSPLNLTKFLHPYQCMHVKQYFRKRTLNYC